MHNVNRSIAILILCFLFVSTAMGQGRDKDVVGDWWLWPDYTLGENAKNAKQHQLAYPAASPPPIAKETVPYTLFGANPTGSIATILPVTTNRTNPDQAFTVELWLLEHVNQPVGAAVLMHHDTQPSGVSWLLGYYDDRLVFSVDPDGKTPALNTALYAIEERGWKGRWRHVVGTYDGGQLCLYLNGAKILQQEVAPPEGGWGGEVAIVGYLEREPYMQVGDLVKNVRLATYALSHQEVSDRFDELKQLGEDGWLLPETFHFNAGPYLNEVTSTSASLVWETDRSTTATVRYGDTLPLSQKQVLENQDTLSAVDAGNNHIRRVKLAGLNAGTPYFYEIEAVSAAGDTLSSGVLTFQTATQDVSTIAFGVIGDTEGRPHINNQIAKLLWDERPEFVLHTGDVTDGGTKDHKYEWNYEYFSGMGQLLERIPVYPVAGNGEDDLYWYRRYHTLPSEDGYYSFRQGSAEFFMLNSNNPEDFAPGGEQYQWLEAQLKASTAQWKFVTHHHAVYSADDNDYGDTWSGKSTLGDTLIQQIVPLYEKYGVDMVFYGHLHTYLRTHPLAEGKINQHRGVVYVQTGGAGGNLEDFAPNRTWFSAKTYRGHHYLTVNISGDRLNMRMYDVTGRLRDQVDLQKTKRPSAESDYGSKHRN